MIIQIEDNLHLELISESHALPIFQMVDMHRAYLREWLPFVDNMTSIDFANNFVRGTIQRNIAEQEYAFIIKSNDLFIGRIGVYNINKQNAIGEIGYWVVESYQGKGTITKACESIIGFCFNTLLLNRIEIKCGTENSKSRSIPERLNFTKEGVIRQGEWLQNRYINLYLYSLLRTDLKA